MTDTRREGALMRRAAGGERGTALITALIMLTVLGLFLFGFQTMNQNELVFAGYSRNSTLAFDVAEAGIQEGIKRLNLFGANPGATCFVNSMTTGAACAGTTSNPNANTVVYQARLSSNAALFPILSLATSNGATRAVRVIEQAIYKTGFGNVIVGPQIVFQGNAQPITGDAYAKTSLQFQQSSKAPSPGAGATATNLVSPQALAGTTISVQAGGPGPYTYECGNNSTTEVAPTSCTGDGGRAVDAGATVLPVNWHPMVPVAMATADFTAIVNGCYSGCAALGVTIVRATQGPDVTYTPVSYTPSYWTQPGANSKVLLAVIPQPICVIAGVLSLPSGSPPCGTGHYYGQTGSTMRFVDWGLITDDLTRGAAQTFFQSPSCTAPCANAGNQNGIRYVPLMPSIDVLAIACNQNVYPGINAFYNTTADGKTCANPPTVAGSTTFSGTKSNPEFLTIDNGAPGTGTVQIFGSINSGNTGCSTSFDGYNWGVIIATGDLDLQANLKFSGIIYTPGNVYSHGNVAIQGGIFALNDPSSSGSVNQVDQFGTVNFCGGSSSQVVLNPTFFTFSTVSWQDRPAGQP